MFSVTQINKLVTAHVLREANRHVVCPYCKKEAELVDSSAIYSKSYGLIYLCKPCDAYVGVHFGTVNPLGTLANKETREARKVAHRAFDNIWQRKLMTRHKAYKELAKRMGKQAVHIGEADVYQCALITAIAQEMFDDALKENSNVEKS